MTDYYIHERVQSLLPTLSKQPEQITEFLAQHEFPLVDSKGATFVFHGSAEAVYLQHWAYELPNGLAFTRLEDTDLWYVFLALPYGARLEYKINIVRDGNSEWINDPLNPLIAHDPFGANSVCQAFGYERPVWTLPSPAVAAGRLEQVELYSSVFKQERRIAIYHPKPKNSKRYPLLIVHDGKDYLNYSQLQAVLDNLIDEHVIPPLIVALTQANNRLEEYTGDPRHARFIAKELTPFLQQRLPLARSRRLYGLMGASLGGVASLHTAWSYPGQFGMLLLQSGSFAATDVSVRKRGPVFEPVIRFVDAFRTRPGKFAQKVFLSCGRYESLYIENRAMNEFLQKQGITVSYQEVHDGHNWENWRDQLRSGLGWLFSSTSG